MLFPHWALLFISVIALPDASSQRSEDATYSIIKRDSEDSLFDQSVGEPIDSPDLIAPSELSSYGTNHGDFLGDTSPESVESKCSPAYRMQFLTAKYLLQQARSQRLKWLLPQTRIQNLSNRRVPCQTWLHVASRTACSRAAYGGASTESSVRTRITTPVVNRSKTTLDPTAKRLARRERIGIGSRTSFEPRLL